MRAKELLEAMYEQHGTYERVAEVLGPGVSAPMVWNVIHDQHGAGLVLRQALGLHKPRHRVALECSSPELASRLRQVLTGVESSRLALGDALATGELEIVRIRYQKGGMLP